MRTRKLDLGEAGTLTVADIMVSPVRTVSPELSVAELIRVLLSEQITGAPVVDGDGTLVGVVSSSDVIRAMAEEEEIAAGDTFHEPLRASENPGPVTKDEDPQETLLGYFGTGESAEELVVLHAPAGSLASELTVADIMTPATFTIAPEASIRELAVFLTRGRIHRSLVVERGTLRGIVTSSDIVRLLAGDGAT